MLTAFLRAFEESPEDPNPWLKSSTLPATKAGSLGAPRLSLQKS
jgi:hypothetical protein